MAIELVTFSFGRYKVLYAGVYGRLWRELVSRNRKLSLAKFCSRTVFCVLHWKKISQHEKAQDFV